MVVVCARRKLETPRRPVHHDSRARGPSRSTDKLGGRGRIFEMGGQAIADGSGIRVRGPRWIGPKSLRMGRRAETRRQVGGEHMARPFSFEQSRGRRVFPYIAGYCFSGKPFRFV